MTNGKKNDDAGDFVLEIRIKVPKGLAQLAERTLKDAMTVAGDIAKIGRNMVSPSRDDDRPKLKKMDIK